MYLSNYLYLPASPQPPFLPFLPSSLHHRERKRRKKRLWYIKLLQAQNSQRQTEKKLGKKCRELEILGRDAGAVVVQPWADPGEQTTGKKALVSNWTHSSPLSIQAAPIPFLHHDPGHDPPSFHPHGTAPSRWQTHNECKWTAPKSLWTDVEFQTACLEGFVFYTAKTSEDISFLWTCRIRLAC